MGWSIFGYVAGSIIGYFAAEMVLQKTWRVFTRIKGLAVYSVIVVLLVIAIQILGVYENKIPDQAEIKSVLLTNNLYSDQNKFIDQYYVPAPMIERKNITAVRKLHQQILTDEKMNQDQGMNQVETTYIKYELKNGDKVIREYRLNRKLYDDFFKPIYESTEYKRNSLPIFKVEEKKIETINIYSTGPSGKTVIISEPEDVKQAMKLLKKDILADTYEDSIYYQGKGSNIEIHMGKDQGVNLSLSPSYVNFAKWLKEKNWLEQTSLSEKDIDYIIVAKNHFDNRIDPPTQDIEKDPGALKITDKQQIKQAIHKSGSQPGDYIAVFYFPNHYQETYYFDDEHAPDFIKNHFK
jgi:ABC-2 type transport system permease protein